MGHFGVLWVIFLSFSSQLFPSGENRETVENTRKIGESLAYQGLPDLVRATGLEPVILQPSMPVFSMCHSFSWGVSWDVFSVLGLTPLAMLSKKESTFCPEDCLSDAKIC